MIQLQHDFKEFLKLLEANDVRYLLVGGYAVGYYGYIRPTGDMDVPCPTGLYEEQEPREF